jgi:hypothetical protein
MSTVGAEVGVILFGNMFVTLVFLLMIFAVWLLQHYVGGTPSILYRFTGCFGLACVADFILQAIVDLAADVSTSEEW